MKHSIPLTAIFLLTTFSKPFAQSDFREGYVITNDHDTIHGLIDYRGSLRNTKICTFKLSEDSESVKFSTSHIKAYRYINSKFYVSRPLEKSGIHDKFFVECLIIGIVGIYNYRDQVGDHFFIDPGNGKLYELKNKKGELFEKNTIYLTESKDYIRTLKYVFRASPEICSELDYLRLDQESLIDITKKYHEEVCDDEACIIYEKRITNKTLNFGLLIGYNVQKNAVLSKKNETPLYYAEDLIFNSAFYPSFGFYLSTNLLYDNDRWSLRFEGLYIRRSLIAQAEQYRTTRSLTFINDIKIKQSTINCSLFNRYEFPRGKIKPLFQAGVFMEYSISNTYERNLSVYSQSGDLQLFGTIDDDPFPDLLAGFCFGTGLTFKLFKNKEASININYQAGFSFGKLITMSNTLILGLGIPII